MSALKKNKVVRELNAPASRRPSFYNRFLAPIKQSFWALPILGTLLTAQPALSQLTPRNPLNTRYAQGDIRTIGNTLMTCVTTQGFPGTCDPSRNDLPNNGINMQYVNVDPDPSFTVNNSSSARLNIPGLGTGAQSNVLWAGLYWHGRTTLSEARRAQVRIKPPGGTYRQITGNVVSGGSGNQYYQGFVEVTDLVRNGGDGTYTVGDVAADTGDNREAGWSLAVIYRDPNLPYRKLLVYDTNGAGTLTTVATQTTRQVNLSLLEFRTPEANPDGSFQPFTAKLGMVVYDGDGGPGRGTDRVSLNGTVLSTAQNPPDDFFRGVINSFTDQRNPQFNNQFGIDIVQLESNAVTGANNVTSGRRLDEIIGNGRDTATFQFSTDNPDEAFFGGVFSLVIDSPLLNIRKRALSDTAQRGSDVTFTIDVQNRGFVNATGVELDDPLPQGVTLVSVSDPACQNRFPCSLGTITPNQTRTVNVTFRVPPNFQGNTLSNTATATAIEDPGRRSATASVNLTAPTTAIIGDRVFNDSDNNGQQNGNEEGINGVTVELVRNGNVVATTTTATVNGVAGSYSFTGVAPGTYTVRIPTAPPQFPTLTTNNNPFNNITVNAGDQRLDIDFGFRVAPPSNADVVTTKTGPATVAPNGSITYTITARNLGPNTANNVVISDTLPQGVTFVSASDGGTFNNGVVTFAGVNIPSNQSVTRTITVTAPASSAQPLLNVVRSTADTQDPDPNNNNGTQPPARVETTITAAPSNADVVTTKTGPATVAPNGSITYTITARNLGPNTANNVVISDTLPQGVTFNSASDGGTFNNGVVTFGAVNIASGESITRTITVTAPASSAQPLLNVVQSSADTQDPDPNNNNGTQPPARVETTIDNPPNLPPLANDDSIGTNPGVPVNIPVLGNDSDPDNNLNPGSVTIITNPGRGTVTPNPDGTITYTPGPGFTSGTDTFEYQVCDTVGLCDRAIVSVTIPTTAPLPPVAEDRSTPPFPNTNPISVPALRGTDPDGQVVTYTITTLPTPQQGTLLLNGQPVQQGQNLTPDQVGQLVFQPNPNFTGTVTFNYTVTDNQNLTSPPATVTIPVIASPRVQIGDTVFNDVNGNGVQDQGEPGLPNVTVTLTSPGSDGILGTPDDTTQTTTTNNNGNYSFPNLPPGNYRVTITPPSGFSPTTPVSQTISVTNNNPNFDFGLRQNQPQNQPPVANNTSSPSIPSGSGPVQLPTLRGTDPDGSVVSVTIPTLPPPEQGTLFLGNPGSGGVPVTPGQTIPANQIGNLFFQPSPNFTGNVTIPFTVTDNQGAVSPPATLTIPVTAQTQPPVANNDVAGANPGQPVNINPLINDRSPDGTPLNPATLRIVSNPTNGTVQVNPDGTITYTPNPGFTSGTDTFVYEICDTRGACDTATVTVTVPAPAQLPPVATDDRASTNPNTPVAINVLDNDTDPNNNLNPTTVTIVTPPTNGTVSVNPVTGQITYTPNPGFNSGTDTFEYQVCDTSGLCDRATVTVTIPVTATNPPVANNDSTSTNPNTPVLINILANDSDPDNNLDPRTVTIISPPANGTVRVNPDGTVVYTPNPGFTNGTDIFTYQVCDSTGLCDTATVTVTVPAQLPRPPVATNDTTSTNPGTPVLINVAGNDRDPDGNLDPSTVQVINPPSNGTVRIDPATGNIIYQPNPGFNNGTDTFTYRICDTTGLCSEATVTVTVPVTTNPPPVANPDAIATNPNTPVTINVLGNDSGNLNPATLRIVTPPANGRVVINPDGTVTYIPNPGFTNGTDTFTYQICDTAGNCTEARVTVAIPQLSPTQAEVQINLTAPTTPIAAGTNVTFNTQVTNNGPGIAQGVTLTVPLPAGVTFVSATPAQGTCVESNGNITCNLGNLNPGQTVSIPIVLRPTQPETINLTTTVTAQNEAIVNNNTATAGAVAIAGTPRVILVKRITAVTSNGTTTNFTNFVDDPTTQNDNAPGWSSLRPVGEIQPSAPLGSGDIVEYTVYFLSDGSVPAQNVNFCDAIPTDTTFISDGFAPRTGIQLNQAGTNTLLTNAQDGDVGAFFSPLSPLPNGNACAEQSNRNGSVILNLREITNTPGSNFGFVRFRVIID